MAEDEFKRSDDPRPENPIDTRPAKPHRAFHASMSEMDWGASSKAKHSRLN